VEKEKKIAKDLKVKLKGYIIIDPSGYTDWLLNGSNLLFVE